MEVVTQDHKRYYSHYEINDITARKKFQAIPKNKIFRQ